MNWGSVHNEAENIDEINRNACPMESALKKIHANTVNPNVILMEPISPQVGHTRPWATMFKWSRCVRLRMAGKI